MIKRNNKSRGLNKTSKRAPKVQEMVIKSSKHFANIQKIRKVSKYVAIIINSLKDLIIPGNTPKDLETFAKKKMEDFKINSSCYGYSDFPSYICVSVNEVVTHGIVVDDYFFKPGDLVSVDVACNLNGYHGDAASSFIVEGIFEDINKILEKKELLNLTKNVLYSSINNIKPNFTSNQDIGLFIQNYVQKYNEEYKSNSEKKFYLVKDYGGHGIGKKMHMKPYIPNYFDINIERSIIKSGSTICIEPLIVLSDSQPNTKVSEDGYSVIAEDKHSKDLFSSSCVSAAHFEHTILIGKNKIEILTTID